jgi:hypothetical protein
VVGCKIIVRTLILGLYFDLRLFVDFLGQFSPDIAKVRHCDTGFIETLLSFLQLIIRELQLAKQVSDTLGQSSPSKKMTTRGEPVINVEFGGIPKRMNTINDFRKILLLV